VGSDGGNSRRRNQFCTRTGQKRGCHEGAKKKTSREEYEDSENVHTLPSGEVTFAENPTEPPSKRRSMPIIPATRVLPADSP
jgi:hypothetical protein